MTPLSKFTDHELINLFVAGNVNALEVLVLRHKDKLYTSILFLVKDKYLAEDIFQDVFIKIIKKQSHDRVKDMLNQLPADQREVIILRHYGDMSFKDIARHTNCSINTA